VLRLYHGVAPPGDSWAPTIAVLVVNRTLKNTRRRARISPLEAPGGRWPSTGIGRICAPTPYGAEGADVTVVAELWRTVTLQAPRSSTLRLPRWLAGSWRAATDLA
jgi:hypothetical protein